MEYCREMHIPETNIGSEASIKKEAVQREENGSIVSDENVAAAAIDCLKQEDADNDDENFEDAVDTLASEATSVTAELNIDDRWFDGGSGEPDIAKHELSMSSEHVSSASADAAASGIADLRCSSLSDVEDENAEDGSPQPASDRTVIDETILREREACLSDEEKQARKEEALCLKETGNKYFTSGHFETAVVTYTDALATCLLSHSVDRAVIYSNRAAAKMKLERYEDAIVDCTKALEFNPDYMKALLRRAELYERTEKLDEALEDYTKALERDPSLHVARAACMRLPEQIKERNEKMKEEMIGKLKDLGNMVLRPFGLSTNNFKLQQDPDTGSYSVSFQQNPEPAS